MRSIGRRLVAWLVLWLGIAWTAAGVGAWEMVRAGSLAAFDAELNRIAASLPLLLRPPAGRAARIAARYPDFDKPKSGLYYTAWQADGDLIESSASLAGQRLLRPRGFGSRALFSSHDLADGEPVRAIALRTLLPQGAAAAARQRQPAIDVVVCRNRTEFEQDLSQWLFGVVACVVGGCLLSALVVWLVLRSGLRPLRAMARQAEAIDDRSLGTRFLIEQLPEELVPIGSRLNDLLARLQTSFERERRFSSDLAHELRTPVAELKSMSEVALRWPNRRKESDYTTVLGIADRMQHLIEDLLALARLEQRFDVEAHETVAVASLVARLVKAHAARVAEKRLSVDVDVPAGLEVHTVPTMLELILSNLIGNAVEYTPEGGRIRVAAKADPDGGTVLAVGNAPCELSAEQLPHLFDRFWRGEPSRSAANHSGLGLPLARACAESIGGALEARLEQGGWLAMEVRIFGARPK